MQMIFTTPGVPYCKKELVSSEEKDVTDFNATYILPRCSTLIHSMPVKSSWLSQVVSYVNLDCIASVHCNCGSRILSVDDETTS